MTKRIALFITFMIILGFIGTSLFNIKKSPKAIHKVAIDYGFEYDVTHPFPIDNADLMDEKDTLTSKLKFRLNESDIKDAIRQSFVDEDLNFTNDTLLSINDYKVPVTFYDKESRIGFLWLDYNRYGEDFKGSKFPKPKDHRYHKIEFLKTVDEALEMFIDDEETFLDEVLGRIDSIDVIREEKRIELEWEAAMKDLRDNKVVFQDIQEIYHEFNSLISNDPSLVIKKYFGRNIDLYSEFHLEIGKVLREDLEGFGSKNERIDFVETMLKDLRKKLEVNYLASKANKSLLDEWKLSAADMIREPEEFFGYLGLIDQMRIFNPSVELQQTLNNQIIEIVIEKNKSKWKERGKNLMNLISENKLPGIINKPRYHNLLVDIMNNDKHSNWHKRYAEINELGDMESISKEELKILEILTHQNDIFIAPLSIHDERTTYDMEEEEYQMRLRVAREKAQNAKTKKERKALQEALLEISNDRSENYPKIRAKAKEKSKDRLKSDMKKFISWAKERSQMVAIN